MKISLNWLREFIKIAPPYEKLAEDLTMAGLTVERIEEIAAEPRDVVFEVEVTTNRPDWLSHWGVAREAAAVRNLSLKAPEISSKTGGRLPPGWTLELKDAERCPYYSGVLIEGIRPGAETPLFIKNRLTACGIRPISLIVDITNYVLLETGQPLHAFDADTLEASTLKIRRAKSQEKMVLIDGHEIALHADDLVIADARQPVALAGVMGGKTTEVTPQTRNIFLETAYFAPSTVRQSARRHHLKSDSSYRFERRVDPHGVDFARSRALRLIEDYAKPKTVSGVLRAGQIPDGPRRSIKLALESIPKVLGITLKTSEVISILTRLGLSASAPSSKSLLVKIPSFRSDLAEPCDLIEEVARLHGYGSIPETLPERVPLPVRDDPQFQLERFLRPRLAGLGFYEAVTFSLIAARGLDNAELKTAVEVVNPQNQDLRWMRPTLLPSLLNVLRKNSDMGTSQVFLFEIANTYRQMPKGNAAKEERVLALLMSGSLRPAGWLEAGRSAGFHDLKGVLKALIDNLGIAGSRFVPAETAALKAGMSETLLIGKKAAGSFGQVREPLSREWGLESPVFFAEFKLEVLLEHWKPIKPLTDLPRFPAVVRDMSLVVPEAVKAGALNELIAELGKGWVRDVRVFDVFRGGRIANGYKNLGLSVTYQSVERTLVADEVQNLHSQIAAHLAQKYHATFQ